VPGNGRKLRRDSWRNGVGDSWILGWGARMESLACLEMTVNSDVRVGAMAVGDSWILGSAAH
jgi:hypothetical protein